MSPPPGYITPAEAAARDLVTHEQAWQLVVPDVLIGPAPSFLFWQLANQYPAVEYPNKFVAAVIPRAHAASVFTAAVIQDARRSLARLLRKRVHDHTLYAIELRKHLAQVEAQIAADKHAMSLIPPRPPPGF